jgi:PhnB protein
MQAHPYLNFNGRCAEAFRLYEQVLGGKIEFMMTFGESPMADQMPPDQRDGVMHARLAAGDVVLLGSDCPPDMYQRPQGLYVSLNVERAADARRIFDALAEGGSVQMPFEKTFWAAGGFGMLTDRFGAPWMINCEHGD